MAKKSWLVRLMIETPVWVTVDAENEEEASAKAFSGHYEIESEGGSTVLDIMEGPYREEDC